MTESSIHRAVEIVKAAIPSQQGSWVGSPAKVAEFIEVWPGSSKNWHRRGRAEVEKLQSKIRPALPANLTDLTLPARNPYIRYFVCSANLLL